MTRRYNPVRQAYEPSLWRLLPLLIPASAVLAFLHLDLISSITVGAVEGVIIINVRWLIWWRRHPIIPYKRSQDRDEAT